MKRFSIRKYSKDPTLEVVSRSGCKARILYTGANVDKNNCKRPVIALVTLIDKSGKCVDVLHTYDKFGRYNGNTKDPMDLFFK